MEHINTIGTFSSLVEFALSKQMFKSLDALTSLSKLKEAVFWRGSIKDLAALPHIGKIEKLKFVEVGNLFPEQLAPINNMPFLKEVTIYGQPHVQNTDWLTNCNIKVTIDDAVTLPR